MWLKEESKLGVEMRFAVPVPVGGTHPPGDTHE